MPLPTAQKHPGLGRRKGGRLWEPSAVLLGAAEGGEISINPHFVLAHTKPLYGSSSSQARRMGLSALRGQEVEAVGQDTMQHWCSTWSSTPLQRGLSSPQPPLLCPVSLAPSSAPCSGLSCAHGQRGWAGREHVHTKQTSRSPGSAEHPALQHSKTAGPVSGHHSTARLCGSFLLCGWHGGCIWNRYGAAAIGLHTRVNVFVNSAQVRGESMAGQSYRRLVTLPFSPRAPAKFGFFSIMPLNLKPKSKQ